MQLAWQPGRIRADEEGESGMEQGEVVVETEHAIILAAITDPRAFAPLYRTYAPAVLGYCRRRLGNRELAEDATAQTFTKALAALHRFDINRANPGATFRSWLFTIAHNVIVDLQRRGKRRHISLDDEPTSQWLHASRHLTDPAASPEDQAIAADLSAQLRSHLAALPDRQRRIVELRLAGLSGIEIAASMGMSHGAVKSAQVRAYSRLRDLLRPQNLQPETDHDSF